MARSTVHYADNQTNNVLKKLHNKLRPAGTPVQRVEYIIELLLLRIFEVKLKKDTAFSEIRILFNKEENVNKLFYYLKTIDSQKITEELNKSFFPFYGNILSEARKVLRGNLTTKVQDQLVLIQEVFKNSNFTNNVQSGNLEEVISLIAEIDEERLLKTDLLGDAIESALSETGGTKEIGLFRTPDHIRQFMVGLVEPNIKDTIFDPACGTGGFLFDSFEFVMEGITKDKKWPGAKAHNELKHWFEDYFNDKEEKMPSEEDTFNFYRAGISGIEYLGMIRKMAAVNFYIRGLNPNNIRQGDSLDIFDHNIVGTKSVILANPPFGAERDKESYPNVWDEFSKESETTILFVKLMLDSLKDGGKCAVIVSEGFLTWDQASARTLRKMLLEEANLIGVIGLPQGVFVSKSGQGPKTSILFFEKGKKTKNIWFYQVENDGYTFGTNRIECEGSQLVEALNIYHNYIKKGMEPPTSNNSYILPVEWMTSLDPRIKLKIIDDVKTTFYKKREYEREKLLNELNKKCVEAIAVKQKLKEFDAVWDGKIQNEIAKRIDKAYIFSLNVASYKSNISLNQIQEWNKKLKKDSAFSSMGLDEKYKNLIKAEYKDAFNQIKKFDLQNAIEADIVREYLESIPEENLREIRKLNTAYNLLRNGAKYPLVKLGDYIIENRNSVKPNKYPDVNWKVLGVSNEIGVFRNISLKPEETNQSYIFVEKNQFCYNPYRINVGSIALNKFDYENQIISGAYVVFGVKEEYINPSYINIIIQSNNFKNYVNQKANVGNGVRMNFTFNDMKEFLFPLPDINIQNKIVKKFQQLDTIEKNTLEIIESWSIDSEYFEGKEFKNTLLGSLIDNSLYGTSTKSDYVKGKYKILRIGNIGYCDFDLSDIKKVDISDDNFEKYLVKKGDLLIVRSNGNPKLVGKCAVWDNNEEYVYASYLIRFRFKKELVLPKYIMYFFMSDKGRDMMKPKSGGGTNNISATEFKQLQVPLPTIYKQQEIIKEIEQGLSEVKRIQLFGVNAKTKKLKIANNLFDEEG